MSIIRENVNQSALDYNKAVTDQLKTICEPLFNLKISTFAYFRFFDDGKYLYLCNDLKWVEYCLTQVQDNDTSLGKEINHVGEDGYHCFLWPMVAEDELLKALYGHDIWHGLSIFKQQPDSVELWGFAGKRDSVFLPDYYAKNIEQFKKFTNTFNTKAADLIDVGDQSKIAVYQNHKPGTYQFVDHYDMNIIDNFIKSTEHEQHPIITPHGKEIILTKRENQVLNQLAFRKTAKEVARDLKLSPKTVQFYLNKAKTKIGCADNTEAIEIFKTSALDWF